MYLDESPIPQNYEIMIINCYTPSDYKKNNGKQKVAKFVILFEFPICITFNFLKELNYFFVENLKTYKNPPK